MNNDTKYPPKRLRCHPLMEHVTLKHVEPKRRLYFATHDGEYGYLYRTKADYEAGNNWLIMAALSHLVE